MLELKAHKNLLAMGARLYAVWAEFLKIVKRKF